MSGSLTPKQARAAVAGACHRLAAAGLVRGTSGNVSVRTGEHVAITPTGAELASLDPSDIPLVDLAGELVDGFLAPTSELDLHLGAFLRDGVGAVVHTHAPAATALSCVLDELPVVHYELMALGGAIRVAPYATFGTPELAGGVLEALDGRTAALMANHGTLAIGTDIAGAVRATELLEWVSDLYARAVALGTPRTLDADAQREFVETVVARGYGRTQPR